MHKSDLSTHVTTRPAPVSRPHPNAILIKEKKTSTVMVFKPFKSPLIRNPATSSTETPDEASRPTKKPRLEDEPVPKDVQATPIPSRKLLLQVNNRGSDSATQSAAGESTKDDTSDERYFNVLW